MKKFLVIAILFLSCQTVFAQKSNLSKTDIEEYSQQIRVMVKYLEETFSFIGDPKNTAQEKDIIFRESYAKIFKNDEVQIEDDLDDNRSTYINKDVQAYLKDIDFFFKDVKFDLKIDDIKPQTNEKGETYFKVTMMRTINGHNVAGDTVNNTLKRYMEINVDLSKKDLKIASIYTTKLNETEELRTWWNRMPPAWRTFFGENQYIMDTIELNSLVHIYRDSIVIIDDSLRERTLACKMSALYDKLTEFTKITDIDVRGNNLIHSLSPLYELSDLQNLDCSGTSIEDVYPIRNLNKINKLDISNTYVTDISDLRYTNNIKSFRADSLRLDNIEIIGLYHQLTNLSLVGTKVADIKMLSGCDQLVDLNISGSQVNTLDSVVLPQTLRSLNMSNTDVSDLTPLANLENLQVLIIDNTSVTDLSPLANLNKLNEIQCRNTNVSDIMPLKDLPHLVKIYCDNTQIDSEKADAFRNENRRAIVIYETKVLQEWWNRLHVMWQVALADQNGTSRKPTPEELHSIISMKSLTLESKFLDAIPIERLTNLEQLTIKNTKIIDLTPLHGLHNLKYLNIKNTKISDLSPLENLGNLVEINIENTNVADLDPLGNLPNLSKVYAEGSKVTSEDVFRLRVAQPNVVVIYQTDALRSWWNTLDNSWRTVFRDIIDIDTNPKPDQLQAVANIEEINVDTRVVIQSLNPLTKLLFLKKLKINDNHITDLAPLSELRLLQELCVDGNAVDDLTPIANTTTLEVLSIANTRVNDLNALEKLTELRKINIENTGIKSIKMLAVCTQLEDLNIANSNVKSLSPVDKIGTLRYIKAFNSRVKAKEIEALQKKRPEINIVYH